jgi:hypothetical protein
MCFRHSTPEGVPEAAESSSTNAASADRHPSGVLTKRPLVTGGDASPRFAQGSLCHGLICYTPPAWSMTFAIKAEVSDLRAETFAFSAQKTMYGGRHIAKGDTIFVFASENEGGPGLIASGVITSAKAIAKKRGVARQTPRVSITIRRTVLAKRRLGRSELKRFSDWNDGRPETELNFKFYRQATNKIVGISDEVAAFLRGFF